MFIAHEELKEKWEDYIAIIPAVSVGNVGQLAADLIISTLAMMKVGYFYDDSFLPVVGNDPFAPKGVSDQCKIVTGCEVYQSKTHKLLVVQQRSPFVKGKRSQFVQKLMDWLKEMQFKQIVILSSSYAHERLDCQLTGSQERFVATPKTANTLGKNLKENLKWKELEKRTSYPAPAKLDESTDKEEQSTDGVNILGGGIAKLVYEEGVKSDLPLLVVFTFCSEGDNIPEAVRLASHLNTWLDLVDNKPPPGSQKPTSWLFPSSWKLQYGSRFEQVLF